MKEKLMIKGYQHSGGKHCWTTALRNVLEDFEKVYESWKKIIEYGAKIIYPAHGKSFSGEKLELQLEKRGK